VVMLSSHRGGCCLKVEGGVREGVVSSQSVSQSVVGDAIQLHSSLCLSVMDMVANHAK